MMETAFSFEGIQFQSGPRLDEDVYDISFGGIHSITASASWKGYAD